MARHPGSSLLLAATLILCLAADRAAAQSFTTFETGQVRPLALSPDGTRLFATNTPDGHLEVFAVTDAGLVHRASVPVGLEPTAVAARSDDEVWVVNHLSDSVSVVDVAADPPRVVRTLQVGDEPRDIVFAGPDRRRAFVSAAHRGQNRPGDPQLTTPGVGRADVWVFDADDPDVSPAILTLFGDTPRALAATADGATVYAAVFHSGNQTTTVTEGAVCDGGATAPPCLIGGALMPGGLPPPNANVEGRRGPETGLIVRFDRASGAWRDPLGRDWRNAVRFSLPDLDVFAIDAMATPPVQTGAFAHVGTILFNMAVNPVSGTVYVSNTEARNEVRFEGPGLGGSTVRGRLHQARITVLDGATVLPRHLNPHIDYGVVPSPPGTKERSLATPLGMAVDAAGATLWVAAFGSSALGVLDTAALEGDTRTPDAAEQVAVSGGGPSGLVLDEARGRVYVLTRFDNAVKMIDTGTRREVAACALHSPEPDVVRHGRPVLYDARLTSSNGEASCAACHVLGDFDSLAWDLGNPDDVYVVSRNPSRLLLGDPNFHPLKGPMTTQSLRGMANHGPMHWRGDRTGGSRPGGDPLDEAQAFREFIVAFEGLLGNDGPISDDDMERFTRFILEVTYPPNPIRALDNRLTAAASAGRALYFGRITDLVQNCNGCHVLDPSQGFFGSDGFSTFEMEPQHFKIAHLRNAYQKVGMFGMPAVAGLFPGGNQFLGDQVRGFGFLHDGSVDTLFRFHRATVFDVTDVEARQLEEFVLQFDSNLAPAVGQQVTLAADAPPAAEARLDLLLGRHDEGECDVIVKGVIAGEARGGYRLVTGRVQLDRAAEPPLDVVELRRRAEPGQALTFTCVPPGSGPRSGLDRDGDGAFDRDELDAGADPDVPSGGATTTTTLPPARGSETIVVPGRLTLRDDSPARRRPRKRRVVFASARGFAITVPQPGSDADPTTAGGMLRIYNGAGVTADDVAVELPAAGWRRVTRRGQRFAGWRWRAPRGLSPVRAVVLTSTRLLVRGGGAAWSYTLDEPEQRMIAVRLRLGYPAASSVYCVVAERAGRGGRQSDRVGRFRGRGQGALPSGCPPPPR